MTPFAKVDVDWSRTKAWSEGGYYARIFLNVEDREPAGIVPQHQYEAVLDDVRARLTAIRGLGPWTAEWFLARHLARPRAWPAGDLVLRKAAEVLYGLDVHELGKRLDPFQNLSAHYLLAALYAGVGS